MPGDPPRTPRPVVVSVGGSVLVTGTGDAAYLRSLAAVLREEGARAPLAVTTGGGRTAREYIRLGRELGLTEVELDEVGIDVTRLHARLLAAELGGSTPPRVPTTIARAVHDLRLGSPVVMGGTEPGHTTDAVASLLAVRLRAARLVNATNVDGVYDRDPKAVKDARRIPRIAWPEFSQMVAEMTGTEAGQSGVFDGMGAGLLARAGIPLLVVDGRDLPNLRAAVRGEVFEGTVVG